MTKEKYGEDGYNAIISNVKGGTPDLEDWPVTYDEMVPYYDDWEQAIGVSGDTQDPFIPNAKFPTASPSIYTLSRNFQNCSAKSRLFILFQQSVA